MTTHTLGFIGLGVMGLPICRNIMQKSAARMLVHEPREEARARAVALGAQAASTVADVGAGADIVFTCLPGEDQLRDVIFGDGGLAGSMRRGSTLVDLSTAPVDFTRTTAEALGRRGVDFADAPIARTRQAAEDGTLSITVGAAPEVFARVEPLLRQAASEVTHCGPVGCGQVVKLMNNMVLVQTIVALSEARAIARRAGVAPALLFEALGKGSADSFALRNHGLKAILPEQFPDRAFSTDYALKDIGYALRLARQTGVEANGAALAEATLVRSREAGNAARYWPILSQIVDG
jgi:3-hydroxyisobutyrate dehydrogenase-like beta-hydroxyacid dehydrogenase